MSFHVKAIENGLTIQYTDVDGKRKELAFTSDDPDYKANAKAFATDNKGVVADNAEKQAHDRIDNLN